MTDGYLLMAYNYPHSLHKTLEEAESAEYQFNKDDGVDPDDTVCEIVPFTWGKELDS